jgi:hypothetical protein
MRAAMVAVGKSGSSRVFPANIRGEASCLKYNFGGIEGAASALAMDAFHFKASEPTTAMEEYYKITMGRGHGIVMEFERQAGPMTTMAWLTPATTSYGEEGGSLDTVDIDLSLSAAVDTGLPATMAEDAVFI